MQLNYFREKGAIKFEAGGKLSIVPEKMAEAGRAMRRRYAGIADRVSLSVPYRMSPTTLAELVGAFHEG